MSKWADCSIPQLLGRIAELEANEAEFERLFGRRTYREIAEALRFYADGKNHHGDILTDRGEVARAVAISEGRS